MKFAGNNLEEEKENKCNDCDICGTTLQSIRSLRRHKRQEHIETQPPGGTKRKSTTTSTNVNNPRKDDPNASPPPKIRTVQTNNQTKATESPNIDTAKEVNFEKRFENNLDETKKRIE